MKGLYACDDLKKLSVNDRSQKVQDLKLCFNCLKGAHGNRDCKLGPRRKCGNRHNRLLHVDRVIM